MTEIHPDSFNNDLAQMSADLARQKLQSGDEVEVQEGLQALMSVPIVIDSPARVAVEAWLLGLTSEDGSISGLAFDALRHVARRGVVNADTNDWLLSLSEQITRRR